MLWGSFFFLCFTLSVGFCLCFALCYGVVVWFLLMPYLVFVGLCLYFGPILWGWLYFVRAWCILVELSIFGCSSLGA